MKLSTESKPRPKLLAHKSGAQDKKGAWQSMGVRQKPETCKLCKYSQVGTAFVADYFPPAPRMAFVFAHPRPDDIAEQRPLSGNWGLAMRSILSEASSIPLEEIALCHVVRCMPPKKYARMGGLEFVWPTGAMKWAAESNCRQYDDSRFRSGVLDSGGLISWQPNVAVVALDLDSVLEVEAYKFMVQKDVEKACRFALRGYRPVVLFGTEVLSIVAGHLQGGSKKWRGHFWELEGWPFEARVREEVIGWV